jgi:hypothetical protein
MIYEADVDSGTLYQYNTKGIIQQSIKLGEHISDYCVCGNEIYVITYLDNRLILLYDFYVNKEVELDFVPQSIIADEYIYVLLNDGFYSVIQQYDRNVKLLKNIKTPRQIGDIFLHNDKLIFNGLNYTYVFNKTLNVYYIKKAQANACADIPILL